MLDVLIPVPHHSSDLLEGCLDALEACTDFKFNTVVHFDGLDPEKVSKRCAALKHTWRLLTAGAKPVYLNKSIAAGLEHCRNQFVAIVAPHIRLDDEQWFAKAKHIFDRDSAASMVTGEPATRSTTLAPYRLTRRDAVRPGCQLAILKRGFASATPPTGDIDPIEHYVKLSLRTGHVAWHATAIRYNEVAHKKHERWHEPLVRSARSASRSQTTQD